MKTLDDFARQKLDLLDARLTRRRLTETIRRDGVHVERDGRRLVSFCCNDYLNLSHHPKVLQAALDATRTYGAGAAASRLGTGNHPLFAALEQNLARFKATEDAIVFGSGYMTNLAVIGALTGPGDLLVLDSLAHACLHAGAQLSGAETLLFRHNDIDHLHEILQQSRHRCRHCIIGTESVFSMDGDRAPVAELNRLAALHDAWLLVDDAHGIGVVSSVPVALQVGTLSKALGSYGGYLCASAPVVSLLHSRARPFVYSTGLPPASVAAASAALDLIVEDPAWAMTPLMRAKYFSACLGLSPPQSQIVPILLGEPALALAVSRQLEEAGFLVTAIRPPTVPPGTARIRLTFTANHTEAQIEALVTALRPLLRAT